MTRGDSQARHETLRLVHHRLLKKRGLNNARHERRGYMRGSKAWQVFPCTFSLLPCLGFPRQECSAGIKKREPTRQDTSAQGYTRAYKANVSTYILALTLSRILLARVYSWHRILTLLGQMLILPWVQMDPSIILHYYLVGTQILQL